MLAEDRPQRIRNLAESGVAFDGGDDRRHEVVAAARGAVYVGQRARTLAGAPAGANGTQPGDLRPFVLGIDLEDGWSRRRVVGEPVDADDHGGAVFNRLLRAICRLVNTALDEAGLERGERPAQAANPFEQAFGFGLDPRGLLLDRVGAAEGVRGLRHAAFVQQDLLRAQG